jgi:prepilin-type N-terminal cleavage/methylation domain-containing protein
MNGVVAARRFGFGFPLRSSSPPWSPCWLFRLLPQILCDSLISMQTGTQPMRSRSPVPSAFTLVELLLVIAIIGILSALIVTAITNASADSRRVLARQQQAVLQQALNAWIANESSGTNSLASARQRYITNNTSLARLLLIQDYLDITTFSHLTNSTTNANQVASDAMRQLGSYVQFSDWTTNSYPRVNMLP